LWIGPQDLSAFDGAGSHAVMLAVTPAACGESRRRVRKQQRGREVAGKHQQQRDRYRP
jgi:hypothetical protein